MNNTDELNGAPLIHDLENQNKEGLAYRYFFTFLGVAIVVGLVFGFLFNKLRKTAGTTTKEKIQTTAGIADKKTFKDKVEGFLKEGGVDGEGNFHLERPGGQSQNVYLTSTTVDLSRYIGKKVRVWGETFKAQTAGWLMDVGLVEILQ